MRGGGNAEVARAADEKDSPCAALNFPSAGDVIHTEQHARCYLESLCRSRAESLENGREPEIRMTALGDELHFVFADITQQREHISVGVRRRGRVFVENASVQGEIWHP